MLKSNRLERAKQIFHQHGGMLRTKDALRLGIHPSTLYVLRDQNELEQLARGLYRLTNLKETSQPDLITVAQLVPNGVICLISALAYHDITTQIPHDVYVGLPRNIKPPRIHYPPMRFFHMDPGYHKMGVETHTIDGTTVRIYGPEKTVVDCFKFRNKIGLDVAIEALRLCKEKFKSRPSDFMGFAKKARVNKIISPYIEAYE